MPVQAASQFWSRAGDEALLCLDTLWRNDRWHLLFSYTRSQTCPEINMRPEPSAVVIKTCMKIRQCNTKEPLFTFGEHHGSH